MRPGSVHQGLGQGHLLEPRQRMLGHEAEDFASHVLQSCKKSQLFMFEDRFPNVLINSIFFVVLSFHLP